MKTRLLEIPPKPPKKVVPKKKTKKVIYIATFYDAEGEDTYCACFSKPPTVKDLYDMDDDDSYELVGLIEVTLEK